MKKGQSFFHLHLISDATGETLLTVGHAVAAQYPSVQAIEHVYPMVRTGKQLDRIFTALEEEPGIVLYTMLDPVLSDRLEAVCRNIGVPAVSVLDPILQVFQSYLGTSTNRKIGAQHVLDASYFRRIDALNFTLIHDDGQSTETIEDADVILVGISRTSKTPTSIYLANRGVKAANIPLVPEIPPPAELDTVKRPLVVGLIASPERIVHLRENRMLSLNAAKSDSSYIDRTSVAAEIAHTRRLCARKGWPVIDVTHRSIEETAAAIMALLQENKSGQAGRAEASRP